MRLAYNVAIDLRSCDVSENDTFNGAKLRTEYENRPHNQVRIILLRTESNLYQGVNNRG